MSKKYTVLIVEDDDKLRATIADYLSMYSYNILLASDGAMAIELFYDNIDHIDIVLLDGMLPKIDGLNVLKAIRETSDLPVIMISARESESDQLRGFYAGADNYITKPFLLSVLREHIAALLNRTTKPKSSVECGAIRLDLNLRRVYIDDVEITTTPKAYDLLLFFIKNEKMVLSRNQILDGVWGMDYYGDLRTVDTIIKQLRRKLSDKHPYIKSIYGVGYYFEVDDV